MMIVAFAAGSRGAAPQQPAATVDVERTLAALLADEDTDGDHRITIDDPRIAGTGRGDRKFWVGAAGQGRFQVAGTYYLSNLLQQLKLAEDSGEKSIRLEPDRIFEQPVHRLSRSIRERFWDGLTRRIDASGLAKILSDEKTGSAGGPHYLYVPRDDTQAYDYFSRIAAGRPDLKMKVVSLPETMTPEYVRSLDGRHGLLSLALRRSASGGLEGVPFVVPGGRFNEMYGWDSYFIVLGLLKDDRVELAKALADNFIYEIEHYGAILNANRTYYLTRSQPPFFTSMLLAVYDRLPKAESSRKWLAAALRAAILEHDRVWMSPDRLTGTGLSRYYDRGTGPPPEVEPGHFDPVFSEYAKKYGMSPADFESGYRAGRIRAPELDAWFVHDRCMRESGHDTSYRLIGRCADLVTVDLNSLLYKSESDIARTLETVFPDGLTLPDGSRQQSSRWYELARKRKELIDRFLWNPERGMFFDYDFVNRRQCGFVSAATLYPMWAGAASQEQASNLVHKALPLLEMPGGIAGSTEEARGPVTPERPQRQWDYPFGWAPHQILAWQGLRNYGFESAARRLAYRWLFTITLNAADYNGTVPEKFDVVRRSHRVFAEYGNVGTEFSYITREGFGWTNASYQIGLGVITQELRDRLNRLIPPEWIFAAR